MWRIPARSKGKKNDAADNDVGDRIPSREIYGKFPKLVFHTWKTIAVPEPTIQHIQPT